VGLAGTGNPKPTLLGKFFAFLANGFYERESLLPPNFLARIRERRQKLGGGSFWSFSGIGRFWFLFFFRGEESPNAGAFTGPGPSGPPRVAKAGTFSSFGLAVSFGKILIFFRDPPEN